MKLRFLISAAFLFLFVSYSLVSADDDITIVAPTSEAAEGLDLTAVSVLFKDSENLEEFEKALNSEDNGVNNLDLNDDGEIDFIRVIEEVGEDPHLIVLQVPLAEDEFQDVATIEVEKADDEQYNMHVRGNVILYGADYYVAPSVVHIHAWPIIGWMYGPHYKIYRSTYYWGFYPRWWRTWHPVRHSVYRTRTVRYTHKSTFTVTRTSRVRTVRQVNYTPKSSTLVKKKTVVRTNAVDGKTTKAVKGTAVTKGKDGRTTTTVKAVTKGKDGETKAAKAKGKKVTKSKDGTTTKKAAGKAKKTEAGKSGIKKTGSKGNRGADGKAVGKKGSKKGGKKGVKAKGTKSKKAKKGPKKGSRKPPMP